MERQKRTEEMDLLREEISLLRHKLEQCQRKLLMYQQDTPCEGNKENILKRMWKFFTTEPKWFGSR